MVTRKIRSEAMTERSFPLAQKTLLTGLARSIKGLCWRWALELSWEARRTSNYKILRSKSRISRASLDFAAYPSSGNGIGYFFGYGPGGYGFGIDDFGALFRSQVGVSWQYTTNIAIVDALTFHHVAVTKSRRNRRLLR